MSRVGKEIGRGLKRTGKELTRGVKKTDGLGLLKVGRELERGVDKLGGMEVIAGGALLALTGYGIGVSAGLFGGGGAAAGAAGTATGAITHAVPLKAALTNTAGMAGLDAAAAAATTGVASTATLAPATGMGLLGSVGGKVAGAGKALASGFSGLDPMVKYGLLQTGGALLQGYNTPTAGEQQAEILAANRKDLNSRETGSTFNWSQFNAQAPQIVNPVQAGQMPRYNPQTQRWES